jgi:CRP-like cAMP-binding protein
MDILGMLLDKYKVELSKSSIAELNSILIRKEYPKGMIIVDQGYICTDLYIISKGILRQFYYKNGRDISEHFSCEGDITFCIESLFMRKETTLLMETIEPSVIYNLNYNKFQHLCDCHTDINKLYRHIFEYDLILSQRKADSWRFESSHQRYERFCNEYPEAAKRASIAHIASYLLMSPETLSRVRSGVL